MYLFLSIFSPNLTRISLNHRAFIIQAVGGSMSVSTDDFKTINLGLHIYTGGVAAQQLFILFFTIMVIHLYRKLSRLGESSAPHQTDWKPLLRIMLIVLFLIIVCRPDTSLDSFSVLGAHTHPSPPQIRISYRLAEFSTGLSSPLTRHEIFFYIFDTIPMLVGFSLFNIYHPGRIFVGPESESPKVTRAERKEEKRRKKMVRKNRRLGLGQVPTNAMEPDRVLMIDHWSEESVCLDF